MKIQSKSEVCRELLARYPESKDAILNKMLMGFSKEMFKHKCFDLHEEDRINHVFYKLDAFVITPKDFEEIVMTLETIKNSLPRSMKGYADKLYQILTR